MKKGSPKGDRKGHNEIGRREAYNGWRQSLMCVSVCVGRYVCGCAHTGGIAKGPGTMCQTNSREITGKATLQEESTKKCCISVFHRGNYSRKS